MSPIAARQAKKNVPMMNRLTIALRTMPTTAVANTDHQQAAAPAAISACTEKRVSTPVHRIGDPDDRATHGGRHDQQHGDRQGAY